MKNKYNFLELFDLKQSKWAGIKNWLFLSMLLVVLLVLYLPMNVDGKLVVGGALRENILVTMSVLMILGIFLVEIGNRIPILADYLGGGSIFGFFMAAIFGTYHLVPKILVNNVGNFYEGGNINYIELFVALLTFCSVITLSRTMLVKSISKYIPLLIIGLVGAMIGGIAFGQLLGLSIKDSLLDYVLPIMGAGNAGGAIPLSEMWKDANIWATIEDKNAWYARAIAILTVANVIAIVFGALLNSFGEKRKGFTGNGMLLVGQDIDLNSKHGGDEASSIQEGIASSFLISGVLFMASHLLSILWANSFLGSLFTLHRLAIFIILAIVINIADVLPRNIHRGSNVLMAFMVRYFLGITLVGIGLLTDFASLIHAFNLTTILMCIGIILGSIILILMFSRLMKVYPMEAMVTAGLCMANRGAGGDIQVLTSSKRMNLISFAQISTRVGGLIVLILAGVLFGIL